MVDFLSQISCIGYFLGLNDSCFLSYNMVR